MDASFTYMIDMLFFGARNTTFGVPDKYKQVIMRGMLDFALEQLCDGTEECKKIIHDAYTKWGGE